MRLDAGVPGPCYEGCVAEGADSRKEAAVKISTTIPARPNVLVELTPEEYDTFAFLMNRDVIIPDALTDADYDTKDIEDVRKLMVAFRKERL